MKTFTPKAGDYFYLRLVKRYPFGIVVGDGASWSDKVLRCVAIDERMVFFRVAEPYGDRYSPSMVLRARCEFYPVGAEMVRALGPVEAATS